MIPRRRHSGPVAAALLLAGLAGAAAHADDPAAVLPMESFDDHLLLEAKINGEGPFLIVLDTGFTFPLIISDRAADRLGLARDPTKMHVRTADKSGLHHVDKVALDRVTLGEVSRDHVEAVAIDLADARDAFGRDIDGAISLRFFEDRVVTIDAKHGQLTIGGPGLGEPDYRTVQSFLWVRGIPSVQARAGGATVTVLLDTGSAGDLSMEARQVHKCAFRHDWVRGSPTAGAGGTFTPHVNRLDGALRLGELTVRDPIVETTDVPVVGMGVLKHARITIDQVNQRIRFEPHEVEPPTSPPVRTTGLGFRRRPGGWLIHSIMPGTPAAELDIAVDDRVSHINGQPTDEHDRETFDALIDEADRITLTLHRDGKAWDVAVPVIVLVE